MNVTLTARARFDLRDEEFELCPLCVEAAVLWMQNQLEEDG